MPAAAAIAHPNIALIKYWGNRDPELRIPSNGSISMNLGALFTRTRVSFAAGLDRDQLVLNGQDTFGTALERASALLERVRRLSGTHLYAEIESENNFPAGTGIASSASGFAALSLAASQAAGLQLTEQELSRLARSASGSACRSIPGGFVEWQAGTDDLTSYASSFASPEHWHLVDCITIISHAHKATGSFEGHAFADSSPLQPARLRDTPQRLEICRRAVLERDFGTLADVVELDSNLMHAVIMTSTPRLIYWQPTTIRIMQAVLAWRESGLPVCFTVDAGPNVHVLTTHDHTDRISKQLSNLPDVLEVVTSVVGGPAFIETPPS
jgi:diphosphomevalonate decarboxylase